MKNLDYRKYCLIIVPLILVLMQAIPAQTNIPSGNVSGTWALANSPYHINGEITIPNGETLTIEPGVDVIFTGHYKFNVQGRLLAIGTEQDTITFTAQNPETGWHGIRFRETPSTNDTTKIIYCKLQYGKANTGDNSEQSGGAILMWNFGKAVIANCLIDHNISTGDYHNCGGGGICLFVNASPKILNNTLSNNIASDGGAIGCLTNSRPVISGNIISGNRAYYGAGMGIMNSNPLIINNVIIHNESYMSDGGIAVNVNCSPLIINNTIAYNRSSVGGGIGCWGSNPIVINTILYGNSAEDGVQVNFATEDSDPIFLYCDIEGGREQFGGPGAGDNYTGRFEYNISSNPCFVDTTTDNFHLSDSSRCIGAGKDSLMIGSILCCAPRCDYEGCLRPSPKGSKPDIGAFENSLGSPLTGIIEVLNQLPKEFQLFQNYPNPFNPTTTIQYSIPKKSYIILKVFDILGKEVATLISEEKTVGNYEVEFNANNLSSGVYFYQLNAGNFTSTKKMLLMK
jgi:hypothetical protein